MPSQRKRNLFFVYKMRIWKNFFRGLYARDCLRGYKSTIYRAGPIWPHFLNTKTSQNRFQEQPNLLLVIQSDFRISFWKSPDISKVLKDCWSPLFGCMGSFHCSLFTILHGHWYHTSRTKQIRQNTLQRGDLCGESIYVPLKYLLWMHLDRNETHWCRLLSFLSPSPTFIYQAFLWYQNSSSKVSYTSLSPSTIQPRTPSPPLQRHLLSLLPTLPRTNLQYCFRPDPRKRVDRNESLRSLPTRQTYDASFSNVLMFGVVDAACSCWVPKKCVKKDVEK